MYNPEISKETDIVKDIKAISENCNHISDESSILDFVLGFSINAMNFITNIIKAKNIPHEIIYKLSETPLSLYYIKKSIHSMEMRKEFIEKGYAKGVEFLDNLQNGQDLSNI